MAVKGMPTAVGIEPPVTGFQGYWPNFHIMILDNRLKFDEGRKTPVGRRTRMYQDCAESVLFNEITTELMGKAIKDAVLPLNMSQMAADKQSFIDGRLRARKLLAEKKVRVRNVPRYEQDVVALFHELIASGTLPYYSCLDCSSKSAYDAIFEYSIPKANVGLEVQKVEGSKGTLKETVIVEYKLNGEDLILDIASDVKYHYMIDILICWEIDEAECRRRSATLITKPLTHVRYWGTTHEVQLASSTFLSVGRGTSVDVIALKDLLDLIKRKQYKLGP